MDYLKAFENNLDKAILASNMEWISKQMVIWYLFVQIVLDDCKPIKYIFFCEFVYQLCLHMKTINICGICQNQLKIVLSNSEAISRKGNCKMVLDWTISFKTFYVESKNMFVYIPYEIASPNSSNWM